MKIVLIGIQGAGKSTQGNLLSKQLNLPYLSTGHIFREIAKEKTQLGRYVKELINSGALIPDEKTIEIVNSYLSRPEYRNGYILDGFPRTLKQAKEFINNVDRVVHIDIDDKEALWRLAYRKDDRDDDNIQAIRKRIELFHKYTKPVLDYYAAQGKLVVVNGMREIKEINEEILKSLGFSLEKNHAVSWKQNKKTIIALVGMPGSGKSEAAKFFRDKGIDVISFSNVINDYIDAKGLKHTEQTHSKLRREFREKYGPAALAVLNKDLLEKKLQEKNIVCIEGMRSWEEYTFIKKEFPHVRIFIVALYADKKLRHKRISMRKHRSGLYGEERDVNELIETNMGPTIAYSDFLIKNNYSLDDLNDKLEEVYRAIYYT
ncbi:MAG: nucleoside monophosphate kinase [Patescibacteria group bacterium]|nr:nucleoside monophosphate kinase [Patescibacteria group bacterium]